MNLILLRISVVPHDVLFFLHVEAGLIHVDLFFLAVFLPMHAFGSFLSTTKLSFAHPLRFKRRVRLLQHLNLTLEAYPLLAILHSGFSQLFECRSRFRFRYLWSLQLNVSRLGCLPRLDTGGEDLTHLMWSVPFHVLGGREGEVQPALAPRVILLEVLLGNRILICLLNQFFILDSL